MNVDNLTPGKVYTPTRSMTVEVLSGNAYTLQPGERLEYVRPALRLLGLIGGRFFRRINGNGAEILLFSISDLVEVS